MQRPNGILQIRLKLLTCWLVPMYVYTRITPDGNNFVDFSRSIADRNTPLADGSFGKDVIYKKYGAFTQVTKTFFDNKLKFLVRYPLGLQPLFRS
jgi:hypothetical protein